MPKAGRAEVLKRSAVARPAFGIPLERMVRPHRYGRIDVIYKTSELTGALLDSAVAKAEGMIFEVLDQKTWGDGSGITFVSASPVCRVNHNYFEPSTSWAIGGPIIDRERIELLFSDIDQKWTAITNRLRSESTGSTPLTAAMRAFVLARCGAEVDL